jgi:hypothetical protein
MINNNGYNEEKPLAKIYVVIPFTKQLFAQMDDKSP